MKHIILVVFSCNRNGQTRIDTESDLVAWVEESLGGYDSIKGIKTKQLYGLY